MYDYSKLVKELVWQELLQILPTPRQRRFGRKRCSKEALLNGVLQVLVNGVKWNNIAKCGAASATSCWRYFHELQRRGKLKLIYKTLAREKIDIREGMIDTATVDSSEFRNMICLTLDLKYSLTPYFSLAIMCSCCQKPI